MLHGKGTNRRGMRAEMRNRRGRVVGWSGAVRYARTGRDRGEGKVDRVNHRHANLDLRFCSSSKRLSNCALARSLARRSSSSRLSSDCFSSTIDRRTLTTSFLASCNSVLRVVICELRLSRSRASSVACMRALRTMKGEEGGEVEETFVSQSVIR